MNSIKRLTFLHFNFTQITININPISNSCTIILTKEFKYLGTIISFLIFFIVLSLTIFGFDTHIDLVKAVTSKYTVMRCEGASNIGQGMFWVGYSDFLIKLCDSGYISLNSGILMTRLVYAAYVIMTILLCFLMFNFSKNHSFTIFATFIVLCLTINFRYDHGVLLFAILPFVNNLSDIKFKRLIELSIIVASLYHIMILILFKFPDLIDRVFLTDSLKLLNIFSLPFIGINMLLFSFIWFWIMRVAKIGRVKLLRSEK